ncbi:uncharacterized protein LOC112875348 isoform X3 [Panicum hallii]|uniref:uncharacterized protein LOC112875348 isoform X3 n=1 Tax=Panicum hallii TaxID=206008 RepID=UPI000DF4EB2D|nr:uncharacterized protein LOC112875348 isoform X3 [Panicum hallii]
MQAEVHRLVAQIGSSSRKTQAMLVLANFEAKSKKASSYMNIGQQIPRDAHQTAIRTLRTILQDEVNGNISQEHHDQTHGCDEAQADDVDMHDTNSLENRGSEHVSDTPIVRSEIRENDLSSGGLTNQELNQGAAVEFEQNRTQEQVLPTIDSLHNAVTNSFYFPGGNIELDNEMEGELSPVCTQVHTDVTIDRVMTLAAAKGDAGPALPNGSTHDNVHEATSHVDSLVEVTDAYTTSSSPRQVATAEMTRSAANVVAQTAKQVPYEVPYESAGIVSNTDDALGPVVFRPCTPGDILHCPAVNPRPQRLTKRPAMYVSPFKGDPQRAKVPLSKALAVRKKFNTRMKYLSGSDILASFIDGEKMLCTRFMSYFVACMSHDGSVHMIDGGGYRVFLSPDLGEYVNIEEDEDISHWESPQALAILQRDIEDVDPNKVKLGEFLLPVVEKGHYSIYCINFIHDRIDVLDSSPEDHRVYHQVLGDRIIRRLNLLFQLATDSTIKQFTRFKRPIIDECFQSHANDCGFFAIKFMELWNGESFHVSILTENI